VTTVEHAPLLALTTHARGVPAADRSEFASRLRDHVGAPAVIVETCHRVEAYVSGAGDPRATAATVDLPGGGAVLTGDSAARHAIATAVGTDSVVIGEDQILHQLRAAVEAARVAGALDADLDRLFSIALRAGRRARSWRQGPTRSLGDVAIAAIERSAGSLRGRPILVVGAGQMGRLAARAAHAAAAEVTVTSRSHGSAEALAASVAGWVAPFDPGRRLGSFAGALVALGGPWPIGPETVEALRSSATIVVDLSVPPAVSASATAALGPRLITADDLATADPDEPAGVLDARLGRLIERSLAEYRAWHDARDGRAAAQALASRADEEREAELAALWRRLPDLDPEARAAIDRMTRHLAGRLLREPLERLGRDGDGHVAAAVRDVFAL
jgi:glutamyl-tRNA reductase